MGFKCNFVGWVFLACLDIVVAQVPTKNETNIPFLVGMIVLLCVLFIILMILVVLLCYRRTSRCEKKNRMLAAEHRQTHAIRTHAVRPNTSPAVPCEGLPGGVSTMREGVTIGGGASGCRRNTSQHLANYLSMDEQQLCEMSRREAAVAEAGKGRDLELGVVMDGGVIKTRGASEQKCIRGDEENGGASPSISLPPSPRDCDVLRLDSSNQSLRNASSSPGNAPPEAELHLDEGRSSVLGSSRRLRGDSTRSGWTSSGDITELKPRRNSKTFRLPPPPLTTPPATPSPTTPSRRRVSPPHTPPFDAEDHGIELDDEEEARYDLTQERHERKETIMREQKLRSSMRSIGNRSPSRDGSFDGVLRVNRDLREHPIHDNDDNSLSGDNEGNSDIQDKVQVNEAGNRSISEHHYHPEPADIEYPSLPRTSAVSSSLQLPPLAPLQRGVARGPGGLQEAAKSLDMALDAKTNAHHPATTKGQDRSADRDLDLSIDLDAVHSPEEEEVEGTKIEIKQKKDRKYRKSKRKHHSRSKQKHESSNDIPDDNIKDLVSSYKRTHLKSLDGASIDFSV